MRPTVVQNIAPRHAHLSCSQFHQYTIGCSLRLYDQCHFLNQGEFCALQREEHQSAPSPWPKEDQE